MTESFVINSEFINFALKMCETSFHNQFAASSLKLTPVLNAFRLPRRYDDVCEAMI